MTHQLVFQFDAVTSHDYDRFVSLSETIGESLPDGAILDGHDFGFGEFNIFIHANDPEALFELVCEIISRIEPGIAFGAGCRAVKDDTYIVLWPPNSTNFSVK